MSEESPSTSGLEARLADALGPDFEILRLVGRGRMAQVFLAREVSLRRLVAVKALHPELAVEEPSRKRMLREARSSASIRHPNVVSVHRVGSMADGTPYLVMEYVDGRTMDDVLEAEGPQDEGEVRSILRQMAGALQAAHDQGIVHRDVRPNNIMRDRAGGRYVLADFGVAGILETGSEPVTRLTGAGEILGQVRYAAPEQLEGHPPRRESDVYALAITAYELLTGRDPWEARTTAEIIQAHLEREPRPLAELLPGAGRDLDDLLQRCLRRKPEQRPSAGDVARRLEAGGPGGGLRPAGEAGAVHAFLAELKRRHVYKVGAVYAGAAFVAIQLVEPIFETFESLPSWIRPTLVLGIIGGLPVTLMLAWIYDLTSGGIERTEGPESAGVRALKLAGLALVLAFAVAFAWFWLGRP